METGNYPLHKSRIMKYLLNDISWSLNFRLIPVPSVANSTYFHSAYVYMPPKDGTNIYNFEVWSRLVVVPCDHVKVDRRFRGTYSAKSQTTQNFILAAVRN
jgi:hypothetical protein